MKQLYTRWGERLDSEHILQEYPRPILIRNTDYTILNGEWEYTFTENSERPVEYDVRFWCHFHRNVYYQV